MPPPMIRTFLFFTFHSNQHRDFDFLNDAITISNAMASEGQGNSKPLASMTTCQPVSGKRPALCPFLRRACLVHDKCENYLPKPVVFSYLQQKAIAH